MSPHKTPRVTGTLSFRIVLVSVMLLGVALALMSALATTNLRSYLTDEVDRNLRSSGQVVATQTVDQLINGTESQILPSEFYIFIDYEYAPEIPLVHPQIERAFGTPANPNELAETLTSMPQTVEGTRTNTDWRVIAVQLSSPVTLEQVGSVVIGVPMSSVDQAVANLSQVLAIFVIIIVVIGALISYILVKNSLRGLRVIERATHEVARGNLSARVPTGPQGSEVGLLGESINSMLAQIEQSFAVRAASEQRMREFVSDASHELRTPLATVRGYAELYRLGGVPEDQVDMAVSRIESEAGRMATLVDDLLQLARLNEGRPLQWKNVDLASIALNTVSDLSVRDPDREASVTNLAGGEIESVVIMADQDRITQVVTNLLSNVITHTPADTPVEVAVGLHPNDESLAILEVRDHGPGIPLEDQARIFERFYRTDSSRSRGSGGGSGLGLAIVAAIMGLHGGSARTFETPGGGLTVQLLLPTGRATGSTAQDVKKRSAMFTIPQNLPFVRSSRDQDSKAKNEQNQQN